MKRLFVLFIGLLMFQFADAQIQAGATIGVSTTQIAGPSDFVSWDSLKVQASDAGYSIRIGGFVHVPVGPLYIRTMPSLGSSKIDYSIEDTRNIQNLFNGVKEETFLKLDLPVLVGMKFLKVARVQAGPVGTIVLNSTNELSTVEGLVNSWDGMTWGFQAGVGLNLKKISVDVNWEGGLSGMGDNITFAGQNFNLDARQNRWVVTVGYNFIGG